MAEPALKAAQTAPQDAKPDRPKERSVFRDWRWWTDFIWPSCGKLPPAKKDEDDKREKADCELLKEFTSATTATTPRLVEVVTINKELLEAETERRRSVEARLMAILALTSVAVMLVIAIVTFLTKSDPRASAFTAVSVIGISGLGTYIILQFLCALGAAISGLERGAIDQHMFHTLLRIGEELENDHCYRVAEGYVKTRRQMADLVNKKVTQMAIAQLALKNAVRAMLLIAVALFGISIQQSLARKSDSGTGVQTKSSDTRDGGAR